MPESRIIDPIGLCGRSPQMPSVVHNQVGVPDMTVPARPAPGLAALRTEVPAKVDPPTRLELPHGNSDLSNPSGPIWHR